MRMMTDEGLKALRQYLADSIAYAVYRTEAADGDETDITAEIHSKGIGEDGRITVTVLMDESAQTDVIITQVGLYNAAGTMLAVKAERITKKAVQEGILYRFRFTISEEE